MQTSSFKQNIFPAAQTIWILLKKSHHLNIFVFILSAYIMGVVGVFDYYTYLLQIGRVLMFKYSKGIEDKPLLIVIFIIFFLCCMSNQCQDRKKKL